MIEKQDVEHAEASARRRAEAGCKNDQSIVHELDRLRGLVSDLEEELEEVAKSMVDMAHWPYGEQALKGDPITPSQLQALREALEFAIEEATFEQRWKGRFVREYLSPKLVASALRELLAERSTLLGQLVAQRFELERMVWALFF